MFRQVLEKVSNELSGRRALDYVAEISAFHRIQASPGYRAAAHHALEAFKAARLEAEILSYPANLKTSYWSCKMFQEWDVEEAELFLVDEKGRRHRLCSFAEDAISLIQRSAPTSPEGVETELVVVDRADELDSYKGVDVRGKVVLVTGDVNRARELAVERFGAIGLLTDSIREVKPIRTRMDIPDALQYTSFWWTGRPGEKCFGFVLSPKQGESLRKQAASSGAKGRSKAPQPLRVFARVKSRLYDGHIENVSAAIPGETREEVLVVAHLCHPRPSANDNASGSGVVLEVARTLQALVSSGSLPQPRRGIRFLLVPEMTGTYAYLATREKDRADLVAAVNLDMVGENQERCKGPLQVERPPQAIPSYTADLLARIMADVARDGRNLAGTSSYPMFKYVVTAFSGGSDHYILSDPSVGIPCPMLIQWPDLFYHTNEDTIDKVDPEMLRRVGLATAVYAYFLAAAGYPEALWLASEMAAAFPTELHAAISDPLSKLIGDFREHQGDGLDGQSAPEALAAGLAKLDRKLTFLLDRKLADVGSLKRLLDPKEGVAFDGILAEIQEEMVSTVTQEQCRLRWVIRGLSSALRECATWPPPARQRTAADRKAAQIVPRRIHPGPVSLRGHLEKLPEKRQEEWRAHQRAHERAAQLLLVHSLYWVDGRRTLLDVADLVEQDSGLRDTDLLLRYFELLSELKLVRLGGATSKGKAGRASPARR
ncbi:MAG: DUF4910 domain-containing protein [Bacillota bacterium]